MTLSGHVVNEAARCASCLYVNFERRSVVDSFPGEDGNGGGDDITSSLHTYLSEKVRKLTERLADTTLKVRRAQTRVHVSLTIGRRAAYA